MNNTKIQYIIIKDKRAENLLSQNYNLQNRILDDLRYYPRDLVQFLDRIDYFDYVKKVDRSGIQVLFLDFQTLNEENNTDKVIEVLQHINRICVFFFSIESFSEIGEFLRKLKTRSSLIFYYNIHSDNQLVDVKDDNRFFIDVNQFYGLLKRDSHKFSKQIKNLRKRKVNVPQKAFENTDFLHFKPIVSNALNIYQADNIPFISNHGNWAEAPLTERQDIVLDSVKILDDMHKHWGKENELSEQFSLPTLILVFPYHNPLVKRAVERFGKSNITKTLMAEQDDNYVFSIKDVDDSSSPLEEVKEQIITLSKALHKNLDGICYLHSSFQFSPIIRFPNKSSKINSTISMVSLSGRSGIRNSKTPYKAILKIGKNLNEIYLNENVEEYLHKRNGQTLIISDLPIEWMLIKGVPLGFISDVCRIQDSNIQGLINNYSALSKIEFKLGSKSVKRTLVIFSRNEQDTLDFSEVYSIAVSYGKKLGFTVAMASSAKEVKKLLDKFKPEILIFDCHCNYDKDRNTCYLQIGEHWIFPKHIVEYSISAPIVYLASCNTNPNYDNVEKLHDAFFQSGAVTITGTFLPINMLNGTMIYLRMLNLLNSQNERKASGNWLHLVCFSIRTSVIWEARLKCIKKLGRDLNKEEEGNFMSILQRLHCFTERKSVFTELMNGQVTLSDELKLSLADTNLEFMFYNHYGRPDLIKFRD